MDVMIFVLLQIYVFELSCHKLLLGGLVNFLCTHGKLKSVVINTIFTLFKITDAAIKFNLIKAKFLGLLEAPKFCSLAI